MWPNTGAQGFLQAALKTLSTDSEGLLGLFFGIYCGVWTVVFMAGVGRPAVLDQRRSPPSVHHIFPPLVWDAPLGVNVWGPPSPLGSRVLVSIIPQIGDRILGVASLPWGGSSSSGFYELGRCMVGIIWVCEAVWRVCYGIGFFMSCECSAMWYWGVCVMCMLSVGGCVVGVVVLRI